MSELPLPEVEGVTHRWVQLPNGLRVHVAEAGEGPPLLLLHGWPQHWWMWKGVIGPLAESHRVVCPDMRGHGWSDAPPWGYEKENLASDTLALLDALEIESVGMMGHDWGGWVGYLLCLRAPERIERLLALNIAHPFSEPSAGRAPELWRLWYQVVLGSPFIGERLLRSGAVTKALKRDLVPDVWSEADAHTYLDPFTEPARARAGSLVYRSFLLRDLPALVRGAYRGKRLRQPVLALHGTRDVVVPYESVADLPRYGDDARAEPVEGVTHFIVDEVPELVAGRAKAFFT